MAKLLQLKSRHYIHKLSKFHVYLFLFHVIIEKIYIIKILFNAKLKYLKNLHFIKTIFLKNFKNKFV